MANPFSKIKTPNCFRGYQYAEQVCSGEIPSCIYIRGSCDKFIREVAMDSPDFYFDSAPAENFLKLVQRFPHVIGKWETENIVYEPWQCWVWMNIMGFISRHTGFRRYRIAHIEVARGNAKSAMASQAALYFMSLDNPAGNQVATAATKKEQARIVLDSARAMARKSPRYLSKHGVRVLAHSIVQDSTNSLIRALSSEASSLDGLNDVLAVCDELHAMNRETFDVIYSGMSKRKDSLTLCITTAGFDIDSVGYSQTAYAKKVALGEERDDQFFSAVYTLDKDDDIYDEKNWKKANPGWNISVDPTTFKAKSAKTKVTPADLPNFKVKHLNLWVSEMNAFFDTAKWDECYDPDMKFENFFGQRAKMGLDLASHIDITSNSVMFRKMIDGLEHYYAFDFSFIPEETVKDVRSDLYELSISQGHLIATPGEAINNDYIREQVLKHAQNIRVDECFYDTWNATEMAQKLANKIEMVKFGMNVANLSEPMKKLDTLIREKRIHHNGSPLVRWTIGNVVAKRDHNDNVFPRKSHVKLKIDPVVAMLMALAGWLQGNVKESIYESTGIRTIGGKKKDPA